MKVQTKVIVWLVIVIFVLSTLLTLSLISYGKHVNQVKVEKQKLLGELTKEKIINQNLIRAQSEMVPRVELNRLVNEELADIKEDLSTLQAKVINISRATGRLEKSINKPSLSDSSSVIEGLPKLHEEISWKSGSTVLPVAWADVYPLGKDTNSVYGKLVGILGTEGANQAMSALIPFMLEDAIWQTGTYDINFSVTSATAETEEGVQTQYVQLWASAPGSEEKVPLAVLDTKFLYADPKAPSWNWLNPHIDAGITGVILPTRGTGGGTLGVTIASYGVSDDDNIVRVGRIAVGTDGEIGWLEVDPIGYNVGKNIPLLDDVWLWGGPVISPEGYGGAISITSTW